MNSENCRANTACYPIMTPVDDEYFIVCYHCKKKWKWQIDEKELEQFRKSYDIT